MKKLASAMTVFGLAACLSTQPAFGNLTLSFDPTSQTVGLGNSVDVAINISGLGDFAADSLGGFDFNVSFDDSILAFDSVVFGDPNLGDQLDLTGFGSISAFDDSVSGLLNLFELSFDSAAILDTLQPGAFTLATMTFDAIGFGISDLFFDLSLPSALSDSFGSRLDVDTESGSISVVPLPPAVLLGGLGLGLVGWMRHRSAGKKT